MTEYIQLELHPDYEIMIDYPHTIRKILNHQIINEHPAKNGYVHIILNNSTCLKHRIIAEQFIYNDDPKNKHEINHINHVRDDNHIDNLEWCTRSENMFDRSEFRGYKYEYIDDIPDDSIPITQYETRTEIREFDEDRYWYSPSTELFYFNNKRNYKILHIKETNGYKQVCLVDMNKRPINMSLISFKRQYRL